MEMHIYVGAAITQLSASREKWVKSGIIKEGDIYRVVATEFGLGLFDFPPTPWWEDENLI